MKQKVIHTNGKTNAVEERRTEKNKVTELDVIVTMIEGKPYYEIKYKGLGNNDYNIGYSSYNLENVLKWRDEYFELVNEQHVERPEEIQQYRAIGTVEECREAVEKQEEKTVKDRYDTKYSWKSGYCPVCGCGVTSIWGYCQCCGQKLNWRNWNE